MNNEFDFNDLIAYTATHTGHDKAQISHILHAAFEKITEQVASEGRVEFRHFGTFSLSKRAARSGEMNGKNWNTPARLKVVFGAAPDFRKRVKSVTGKDCI